MCGDVLGSERVKVCEALVRRCNVVKRYFLDLGRLRILKVGGITRPELQTFFFVVGGGGSYEYREG